MLFSKQDPMDDLLDLIRAKNPAVTQPAAAFAVTNIAVSNGDRNTTVTLRANVEYGVKGQLTVALDRTDLSELYNKFPSGTKRPLFKHFGMVGSTITISAIISQINQMLGTAFTVSGDLQDLTDAQFVMPTKDSSIMVSISANPKSVRLVPGTVLEIEIYGSGAILQNALVNRSLNPIVAAAGTIPYGGIAVNPASPKKHPGFAMKYLDFSAIMAGRGMNEVINQQYTYPYFILTMNATLFAAINAKLSANGLAPLGVNSLGQWRSNGWDEFRDNEDYWNSTMFCRTENYASDPLVNSSDFTYFLRLRRSELKQSETATSYATDYYMHYNV